MGREQPELYQGNPTTSIGKVEATAACSDEKTKRRVEKRTKEKLPENQTEVRLGNSKSGASRYKNHSQEGREWISQHFLN
jgi:hypothetical protein